MEKILFFEVSEEFNGCRLDKWLAVVAKDFSRSKIQQFIKSGCVKKNNIIIDVMRFDVHTGEIYDLTVPDEKVDVSMVPENIPLDILYEDDDIIVLNKPAGMVVHQGAGVNSGTLVNALLYHCNGKLANAGNDAGRQGIVHRLDKDTSGAMMACKTDRAYSIMCKQFANHSVKREYYALLWGMPNPVNGRIEKNIARNPRARQEMSVVVDGGKPAITNYETLRVFSGPKFKPMALVKCILETGRTHQIRVHMASIGTPILGDNVYGNPSRHITQVENEDVRKMLMQINRQMLHSENIESVHPVTNKKMKFETPLPDDMQRFIEFFE